MTDDGARRLVEGQARAWERADVEAILADFAADGVLISPGGAWQGEAEIRAAIHTFWQSVKHVEITVTRAFLAGEQGAAEWIWTETRLDDTVHRAEDAIIFELRAGKIRYWREYFDTANF